MHETVGIPDAINIEERFDISLIGALALKEDQIQQNYRLIIAVHKWFARRFGTLFRGLSDWQTRAPDAQDRRPIQNKTIHGYAFVSRGNCVHRKGGKL